MPPASAASPKRVLVVEDEPRLADVMRDFLAPDYVVDIVPDGEAAVTSVEQARPDVVLLDINLPKMSGLQVLRHIHDLYPSLPVIIVTATEDQFAITTALMRGAFAYLPKPFSGPYLMHLVSVAIDQGRRA